MNEKQIQQAASKLGSDTIIDVKGVARRVVAELRKPPVRPSWWRHTPVLRAAAAVMILVTGGVVVTRLSLLDNGRANEIVVPAAMDEFSDSELTEILDSLDFERPAYEFMEVSIEDLDESQLLELLETMEG